MDALLVAFGQFVHEIEQGRSIPASNPADDAFMCRQKKNPVIGCRFRLNSRPQDDKKSDENTRGSACSWVMGYHVIPPLATPHIALCTLSKNLP
jgi:hypothetical protein